MLTENVLPIVDERMVDTLLLEMLHTDQPFRKWFSSALSPAAPCVDLMSARHSVFETSSGETDIETVWRLADGRAMAVLASYVGRFLTILGLLRHMWSTVVHSIRT